MQKPTTTFSRTAAWVAAAVVISAAAIPAVLSGVAGAGIPSSRSITMSSSAGGATDVTYSVAFTTDQGGAASNIEGMVIEFCGNSSTPIIGDACTAPTGFDINEAGLALTNQTGITGFAIDAATDTNTLVLTRTVSSINNGTAVTIDLGSSGGSDGITNPDAGNSTFYARILTYATAAGATGYASATPGTYVDAGGVALSTANQIQITAKVQERLTFCVYTGGACTANTTGSARTSSINLGNANGVLDPTGEYVSKSPKFNISTNALSGATVVLKGGTLTSGGFSISAIGGTAAASSVGGEQFGMCLWQSAGSGLTVSAPYNNGGTPGDCDTGSTDNNGGAANGTPGTALFAFDTAATTASSGDVIATKPAGATSTATMAFVGNISDTTEAGIYQTTLTFIATGTY